MKMLKRIFSFIGNCIVTLLKLFILNDIMYIVTLLVIVIVILFHIFVY